jgi:hypothetical protein
MEAVRETLLADVEADAAAAEERHAAHIATPTTPKARAGGSKGKAGAAGDGAASRATLLLQHFSGGATQEALTKHAETVVEAESSDDEESAIARKARADRQAALRASKHSHCILPSSPAFAMALEHLFPIALNEADALDIAFHRAQTVAEIEQRRMGGGGAAAAGGSGRGGEGEGEAVAGVETSGVEVQVGQEVDVADAESV